MPRGIAARLPTPARAIVGPVLLVLAALGCQAVGGRTVEVEFDSAEGIESGRPVYFAGVLIGKTQSAEIVGERARVPVRLFRAHRDTLPDDVVFVIAKDPNRPGKRCLEGHTVDGMEQRVENGVNIYMGVANKFELGIVKGTRKARGLWNMLQESKEP